MITDTVHIRKGVINATLCRILFDSTANNSVEPFMAYTPCPNSSASPLSPISQTFPLPYTISSLSRDMKNCLTARLQ